MSLGCVCGKSKILHTRCSGVCTLCVYLLFRLDYALLRCYTPLFNLCAGFPLNHIAKTVLITSTTVWFEVRTYVMIETSLQYLAFKLGPGSAFTQETLQHVLPYNRDVSLVYISLVFLFIEWLGTQNWRL